VFDPHLQPAELGADQVERLAKVAVSVFPRRIVTEASQLVAVW
jgi:hypothetical protein